MKRKKPSPVDDDISQRRILNLEEKVEKLRDKDLVTVGDRLTKLEETTASLTHGVAALEGTTASLTRSVDGLADVVRQLIVDQKTMAQSVKAISLKVEAIHDLLKKPAPDESPPK